MRNFPTLSRHLGELSPGAADAGESQRLNDFLTKNLLLCSLREADDTNKEIA